MPKIHCFLPGGTQFVAEVQQIPGVSRIFTPVRILSQRSPDYGPPETPGLETRQYYVHGDNDGRMVPWYERQIYSFEIRVVAD